MDILTPQSIPFETKTNEERGFPSDSFFEVEFEDGYTRNEKDTNWSAFSEVKEVSYFKNKKQVSVSRLRIRKIRVFHGKLNTEMEVPEDCEVYQAFYSEVVFLPTGRKNEKLNGRCVGLVRDGKVIEERFLNAREGQVFGIRL